MACAKSQAPHRGPASRAESDGDNACTRPELQARRVNARKPHDSPPGAPPQRSVNRRRSPMMRSGAHPIRNGETKK
jgi:hypothetical protein